jgi:[ribosomal protein S5]-alanine N-acetyltransferase
LTALFIIAISVSLNFLLQKTEERGERRMDFPVLETKRLVLRGILEEDASALFEYLSREDVTRYYGLDAFKSIHEVQTYIGKLHKDFKEERGIRWAITDRETNCFIGTIGFSSWHKTNRRADIGYDVHPKYWRKGYAIESLICVINYGFNNMNLNRIGAVVFPENIASHRLLKKANFKEEGILRSYIIQNGSPHDTIVYSLLKDEWKSN